MKKHQSNQVNPIAMVVYSLLFVILSNPLFPQSRTIQTDVPALKNVFAKDFTIGCLLSYTHIGFASDPVVPGQSIVLSQTGGKLIQYHMNCMSPGNNMKPVNTVNIGASAAAYNAASEADKDSVNTHPILKFNANMIAQLNWAQRQGFTFRGHTLVWHNQTPAEMFRTGYSSAGARLTKEKMIERMDNYIKGIIQLIHEGWPGLLSAMDVVNEAVEENGADRTTSEWYLTFGDNGYLMKAFELARKYTMEFGETQIKLYYNDYNTHNPQKADGIVRICAPIFQAGYLDGIGMQEHDSNTSPTAAQWVATYNKFDPICTEMAVTELDVTTGSANPSAVVLSQQANQYGQLFKCFVERSYFSGRGKIINVSKDGLNDQYTFKTNQASSLWDANNQCKPAFYAVADVGIHYNALDSLLASADTLKATDYTSESWANWTSAALSAQTVMSRNYSASVSAADSLGKALDVLTAAHEGLVKITDDVAVVDNGNPKNFALSQNYPNPFNPTTRIDYTVPVDGYVSLKVIDLQGRKVTTLFEGIQTEGNHVASFDGSGLSGGVYLYELKTNQLKETKKLMLIK
jgi:GH35 family endo-1,4-beta-xylanase